MLYSIRFCLQIQKKRFSLSTTEIYKATDRAELEKRIISFNVKGLNGTYEQLGKNPEFDLPDAILFWLGPDTYVEIVEFSALD